MDVTLIVCTWNNGSRLADTLDSVCACEVDTSLDWELIVVDNNSTDNTRAVVSSFHSRLPIVSLFEPRQGKSHALNHSLREMKGDLVIFADDDIRPCRDWVDIYWRAYLERPIGFYFGGPVESLFEGRKLEECLTEYAPWSVKGLDWGPEDGVPENPDGLLAANWACPADGLRQAGEFDTSLGLNPDRDVRIGEETDMMQRLRTKGWQPWYLARARIKHVVPTDKVSVKHIAERAAASTTFHFSTASDVELTMVFRASARSILTWTRYMSSRIMLKEWRPNYIIYRKHRSLAVGKLRAWFQD